MEAHLSCFLDNVIVTSLVHMDVTTESASRSIKKLNSIVANRKDIFRNNHESISS